MFISGNKAFASQVNSNFRDIMVDIGMEIKVKKLTGYFDYIIMGVGYNYNPLFISGNMRIIDDRAFLFDDRYGRYYGANIKWSGDYLGSILIKFDEIHKNVACEIMDKYLLVEELKK